MTASDLARAAAGLLEDTGRLVDGDLVLSVSDLVDCPAQAAAAALGIRGDALATVYARYIMELGRIFHGALQAELGLVHGATAEVPVGESFTHRGLRVTIKGRADIVDRDAVAEVKVSAGLGKAREDGPRLAAWLLQLLYYAYMLHKTRAFLLVFDRCQPRAVVVEVEPARLPGAAERAHTVIVERARMVADAVLAGEPWLAGIRGPWCRYCPFRRLCAAPLGGAPSASQLLGLAPGDGLKVRELRL